MSTTVNGTTITFSGSGVLTSNIVSNGIGTSYITNIIIAGYTSIEANAFAFTYITSIYIPNTVTSIGQYAFSNSTLTTISIPASVTSIDQYAFSNSAIASIHVALSNNYYGSDINGVLFDVTGTILIQYPSGKTQSSYIISSTVTTIGQYAFQYSNLSQIAIPASVQTIGNYAFFNNISLTTIVFENNSNLVTLSPRPQDNGKWLILAFNNINLTTLMSEINAINI